MIDSSLILVFGFGLGFIHALDADHVMAVSGLVSSRPGFKSSLRFCSRWALGHGLILLLIALAVHLFNLAMPVSLSYLAESLVGLMLIIIGLLVFRDMHRRRFGFHIHQHAGLPLHGHWHIQSNAENKPSRDSTHEHRALMVGMVHGLAGSAPLLAMVPFARLDSGWLSVFYVLLFSSGVIMAMLIFGGMLGMMFKQLAQLSHRLVFVFQSLAATGAVVFGIVLLQGAVRNGI